MNHMIDISLPIGDGMEAWPGYRRCSVKEMAGLGRDGGYRLTKVDMLTQQGTHIDAPRHFQVDGVGVEDIPVDAFCGDARLLDLSRRGSDEIVAGDLEREGRWTRIVMLKTMASEMWVKGEFPEKYPVMSADAVRFLNAQGVGSLVVDTPSVDLFFAKEPLVHHWLAEHHIYIMESAQLVDVEEGYYELMALPLRIVGADGSPVRACLRRKEGSCDV